VTTLTNVPRARCDACGYQTHDLGHARTYGHRCPAVTHPRRTAELRAKGIGYAGILWALKHSPKPAPLPPIQGEIDYCPNHNAPREWERYWDAKARWWVCPSCDL
jgi:hypothetical protein